MQMYSRPTVQLEAVSYIVREVCRCQVYQQCVKLLEVGQ